MQHVCSWKKCNTTICYLLTKRGAEQLQWLNNHRDNYKEMQNNYKQAQNELIETQLHRRWCKAAAKWNDFKEAQNIHKEMQNKLQRDKTATQQSGTK